MDAVTRLGEAGTGLCTSVLSDARGRLGVSTQSLLVAPRNASCEAGLLSAQPLDNPLAAAAADPRVHGLARARLLRLVEAGRVLLGDDHLAAPLGGERPRGQLRPAAGGVSEMGSQSGPRRETSGRRGDGGARRAWGRVPDPQRACTSVRAPACAAGRPRSTRSIEELADAAGEDRLVGPGERRCRSLRGAAPGSRPRYAASASPWRGGSETTTSPRGSTQSGQPADDRQRAPAVARHGLEPRRASPLLR